MQDHGGDPHGAYEEIHIYQGEMGTTLIRVFGLNALFSLQ
jgi:hypothetical protein